MINMCTTVFVNGSNNIDEGRQDKCKSKSMCDDIDEKEIGEDHPLSERCESFLPLPFFFQIHLA